MLDHHQGHGGSGDAPGAGGPWLAGVDTAGVPGSPTAPPGFASQVRARSCSLPRSATSAPPRRPTSWVPSARLRTRAAAERARAAASLPPIRSPYTVSAPPPQPQAGSAADHDGAYMHQQHRCSTSISSSSTTSTTSSNKAKAAAAVTAAATAAAPAPPPGPRQSGRYRGRKREAQALAPVRVLRRGRRARPIREEQEEGEVRVRAPNGRARLRRQEAGLCAASRYRAARPQDANSSRRPRSPSSPSLTWCPRPASGGIRAQRRRAGGDVGADQGGTAGGGAVQGQALRGQAANRKEEARRARELATGALF